jgi:hypothetical protein
MMDRVLPADSVLINGTAGTASERFDVLTAETDVG